MATALQDLPGKCSFIYRGELLFNGSGEKLKYDWVSHVKGMPYCTIRCTNGYAVHVDLPGETPVVPVSVDVGGYPVPYEEYELKYKEKSI